MSKTKVTKVNYTHLAESDIVETMKEVFKKEGFKPTIFHLPYMSEATRKEFDKAMKDYVDKHGITIIKD